MGSQQESADTHVSVLAKQVLDSWLTDQDGIYVDGTFGRGGHSGLLLERLSTNASLYGFDRDPQAIAYGNARFANESRLTLVNQSFSSMKDVLEQYQVLGKISGLLVDLGVSSPQLDQAERGFSFRKDGALDMRMNPGEGQSAAEWLSEASWQEIAGVLAKYGEEPFAKLIAKKIVEQRDQKPLLTTTELADLIKQTIPEAAKRKMSTHPATKSFQAIRIHINDELGEIEKLLEQSVEILAPGGRLVVISFHSLEDRIVKRFMRNASRGLEQYSDIPLREDQMQRQFKLLGRQQRADLNEIAANPRARSAVLRVAERTDQA